MDRTDTRQGSEVLGLDNPRREPLSKKEELALGEELVERTLEDRIH